MRKRDRQNKKQSTKKTDRSGDHWVERYTMRKSDAQIKEVENDQYEKGYETNMRKGV
jgi:hypothetical protein